MRERGKCRRTRALSPAEITRGYSREGEQFQIPLTSALRGAICLVTPSSLLPKGAEEAHWAVLGGRGREGSSRCQRPVTCRSGPRRPAAALCTQSHLGRSPPAAIGSEPWGTRERKLKRRGLLDSPVTSAGTEACPAAATRKLEHERGAGESPGRSLCFGLTEVTCGQG